MNKAIRIIRDEHRSISAVLSGLIELTRVARNPGVQPDFAVFRAMIHYIDEFPERLHHPKEDQLPVRAARRARARNAAAGRGAAQASTCAARELVRELESALLAFEVDGARGAARVRRRGQRLRAVPLGPHAQGGGAGCCRSPKST